MKTSRKQRGKNAPRGLDNNRRVQDMTDAEIEAAFDWLAKIAGIHYIPRTPRFKARNRMTDRLTELRNRLRYVAETHGLAGWSDAKQAADAIDALTAERDELRAEVERLRNWRDELLDAVADHNGGYAHQIMPHIWPILTQEQKHRAALQQKDAELWQKSS